MSDVADRQQRRSPMRTSPRSTATSPSSTPSSRAAIARSFAWMSRQARRTGVAHEDRRATGRRLLVVRHDGRVAHDDRDPVERRAELVRGDLGEDRAGALAHVRRAGVDDDAAVGEQPDGRVRQAGRRARLEADRDPAAAARAAAASPQPISSAARRDGHRPVAVGRRVAGDERVAAGWARFRRRSSSGSMPRARAASFMFDSTAQICCGIAEAHGTRWTAPCATGRSGRRSGPPGTTYGPSTCSCPSRRSGRRCRRRRRSGSRPRCRGRRGVPSRRKPVRTWTSRRAPADRLERLLEA